MTKTENYAVKCPKCGKELGVLNHKSEAFVCCESLIIVEKDSQKRITEFVDK